MANGLMRLFTGIHAKLVKATGKLGGGTADGSVLVLRHIGAKSGKVRETPLMFYNEGGARVVIASMGGAPTNPGWYHNLVANPETVITVDRAQEAVRARELVGEERDRVWERIKATEPRFAGYEKKTDRVMPLIALEPRP